MKYLLITLTLLVTTGCSTIMAGTTQDIVINTKSNTDVDNTFCNLVNADGHWLSRGESTATVAKHEDPLSIKCTNDKQVGEVTVASEWQAGQVIAGCILTLGGCVVDAITDAGYDYPSEVTIPMVFSRKHTKVTTKVEPVVIPRPDNALDYKAIKVTSRGVMCEYSNGSPRTVLTKRENGKSCPKWITKD